MKTLYLSGCIIQAFNTPQFSLITISLVLSYYISVRSTRLCVWILFQNTSSYLIVSICVCGVAGGVVVGGWVAFYA